MRVVGTVIFKALRKFEVVELKLEVVERRDDVPLNLDPPPSHQFSSQLGKTTHLDIELMRMVGHRAVWSPSFEL